MSVRSIFLIAISLLLTSCFGMGGRNLAPVMHYGQHNGAGSAGVHNVVSGDTLYSISNRYRLPMRDIALLNRMSAPFKLREGQRVRLPPPHVYRVQAGDSLYRISNMFGVNSSEIVRLNNLNSPYILRVGQDLRLPSVARKKPQILQAKSDPVIIENGVPIPQSKPSKYTKPKSINVSKVRRAAPKRASSKFLRPVRGRVLSNYGAKKNGLHNDGINIAAPRGTPVKAAENGVIVYAGNALKGSGNLILVRHDKQWMTAYAHLDKIMVKKGQVVRRGAQIAKVGSTGSVSVPQLHFEVRRGTSAMNPVKYLE